MSDKMMDKCITIKEALNKENLLFIDVRSPGEYREDTIPGALNLPILNDEERKEIGTIYKQQGAEAAKVRGFQMKVEELDAYIKAFRKHYENGHEIVLFCWRGGNRSTYVQRFLKQVGMDVWRLKGGYKSYRKYVVETFPQICEEKKFIVLHGRTGVGKTEILNHLKSHGLPVLDLEGCACNAGSVFGNVFYAEPQPQQKQFETRLFESLTQSPQSYVIVESESKRIGSVYIPDCLFEHMVQGEHYLITTSMEMRIEQIKRDYLKNKTSLEAVIKALDNLRKRLGNERVDQLKEALRAGRIGDVIRVLMTDYYDPMYDKSIRKYEPYKGEIKYQRMEEAIQEIEKIVRN